MALYIALAALLTAADQAIKAWAAGTLKGAAPITIIDGFFRLRYIENDGAAFSMLRGRQGFFLLITAVAFVLAVYLIRSGGIHGKLGYFATAFTAGGAVGNLIDRVRMGYVVDMFDWCWFGFPVFNFADLCITAGAILFILMAWFDYRDEKAAKNK